MRCQGFRGRNVHQSVHQTIEQNTKQYKQGTTKQKRREKTECKTKALAHKHSHFASVRVRCLCNSKGEMYIDLSKSLKQFLLQISHCVTSGYRRFLSFSMVDHTCLPKSSTNCAVAVVIWQLSTGQRLVKSRQQGKSYLQAAFRSGCDPFKEHCWRIPLALGRSSWWKDILSLRPKRSSFLHDGNKVVHFYSIRIKCMVVETPGFLPVCTTCPQWCKSYVNLYRRRKCSRRRLNY